MKIELPNLGHRNLVPFEGIGMLLDVPTDTPMQFINYDTQETDAHSQKLIFKRSAVEAALPTILGMAVCVEAQNFNGHAPRSKVGLTTEAWIEGKALSTTAGRAVAGVRASHRTFFAGCHPVARRRRWPDRAGLQRGLPGAGARSARRRPA